MKHVFVINPRAGLHSAREEVEKLVAPLRQEGVDCETYVTKAAGDARRFTAQRAETYDGPLRFYACGGDGTLHEVVNGAVGHAHAAVGAYPCGSGNDFVKHYGKQAGFLNMRAQVQGQEVPVDLMRVNGHVAINMVHFGLDSKVATVMERVRRLPLIGGKNAYLTGVAGALLQSLRFNCRVWADGELLNNGQLLLCTLAGGSYVGGGYHTAPRSDNQDGLMDVCLVKPMSRLKLLPLMKAYEQGTHLDDPRLKDALVYRRAEQVRIQARAPFTILLDGELMDVGDATVDVLPGAVRFVVPKA